MPLKIQPVVITREEAANKKPSIPLSCSRKDIDWIKATICEVRKTADGHSVRIEIMRKEPKPQAQRRPNNPDIRNELATATFTIEHSNAPNVLFDENALTRIESSRGSAAEPSCVRYAIGLGATAQIHIECEEASKKAFATLVFPTYAGLLYVQHSRELHFSPTVTTHPI